MSRNTVYTPADGSSPPIGGRQLDFDDLTQPLEAVVARERRPRTAEDMEAEAREFYEANADLLAAHVRAAEVLTRHGFKVSSKFLTNFARWLTKFPGVAHELFSVYEAVSVRRGEDFRIPDKTTPWLTRYLERAGYDVTKARSKLDLSRPASG